MFTIIVVIFADLVGFSLLVPVYPILHEYYHISKIGIGYFVQVWAVFLCIGGLFFGILSDKLNRRAGLLIPMIGSTLTYLSAFFVNSYSWLLVCRGFNGFFNGNFVVAMAASADISTPKMRLRNMSAIGAAVSLSWVLGPMVGGLVSSMARTSGQSIHFPFLVSAAFSCFALILTILFFPKIDKREEVEEEEISGEQSVWKDFFNRLLDRRMIFYSLLSIIFMASLVGAQVYFGLWASQEFNFSTVDLGIMWGILGLASFIGQLTINRFLSGANTNNLIVFGFLGMGVSYFVWSLASNMSLVYIFSIFMYFCSTFAMSGINTRISLTGHPRQMGMIFGINQIFFGIGRIIAPTLMGVLVTTLDYRPSWIILGGVFILTGLLSFWVFASRWLEKEKN